LAPYRFDVWTEENGLPQTFARNVAQTPDGYLWIATFDGLVRFDGVRFTIFNRSNTPGITSNRFAAMYESANGDLWLNTEGGRLTRYHGREFQTFGPQQGILSDAVRGVTGDDAGHVWVLIGDNIAAWNETAGRFMDATPRDLHIPFSPFMWENTAFWGVDARGLHCFINGRFVTYPLSSRFAGTSIWGAALDQNGTIWLDGVDGRQFTIAGGKIADHPVNRAGPVRLPYRDGRGLSWTIEVSHRLDRSVIFESSGHTESISFHSMYEDREQNLWFGARGLYRLQRASIRTYSKDQGLIDNNIYAIFQDHFGAIWIGAWQSGLSRFWKGRFTSFAEADGLPSRIVTALGEDRNGVLWVGTVDGVGILDHGHFRRRAGPVLPDRAVVQAICAARDGTLWFGTSNGLVSYKDGYTQVLTTASGLATNDVRTIVESGSGDLWIGGYGGLTRLHQAKFTRWTERNGLPSDNVRALYQDRDGVLWIGTYDGGMGRLKNDKITSYTQRDGLFDNGVFQILEDDRGNMWMSCNRGIYRISKRELNAFASGETRSVTSVAYGKTDGMLNAECNGGYSPAGIKARDGKLWFPTEDGVAVIDPVSVRTNPQPPPVIIESSIVDQTSAPLGTAVQVAPGQENLAVQYTAPSFINSDQIRFRYQMQGLDSGWIDAGPRRTAYYSHLPPGKYVFRVIAGNSDGTWNMNGRSLPVIVLAPYYQTWWFAALICTSMIAVVALAWRYRIAQVERARTLQQAFSRQLIASQENERKRIAAELHDSLGQHLVVINNLALFQAKATEGKADTHMLGEISSEATQAIRETREISFNLRPFQLDRLGLTKAIETVVRRISKASGIHVSCTIDDIDDLFPEELRINLYRIVQESLNNVIKHAQATEVSVRIQRTLELMLLSIEDNGRGFTSASRNSHSEFSGFGMTGMMERAQLLGGRFQVHSTLGRGTLITVEVPLGGSGHD
jgi:signal transduction histidine kinase/ligand-binding sensor domain-containing protein